MRSCIYQIVPVYSPGQTGETFSHSLFFSTTYANKRTRGGQIVPVAHGRAAFKPCSLGVASLSFKATVGPPNLPHARDRTRSFSVVLREILPVAHGRAFVAPSPLSPMVMGDGHSCSLA